MVAARIFLAACVALVACSCSTPTRQFATAIARIRRADPASPAVLSARLTYVELLLNESSSPCAPRLERARAELRTVVASLEARALFRDGWARTADLEYRLHRARASCGPAAARQYELWAAVDAARSAVGRFRDAFDYRSMVILQFDVATALRQLGETAAAIAALRSAIDMDREYGFREDAEDDYRLLLTWRGEPLSPKRVAALMQDFPKRVATLRFGWHAADAAVAIQSRRVRLEDGALAESRASAQLEESVRADRGDWRVSTRVDPDSRYDPGVWPALQGSRLRDDTFPPALLVTPSYHVGGTGDFEGAINIAAFAARMTSDAARVIRAHVPHGRRARALLRGALETTSADFSPELLEAAAARNYSLETAMWTGAKLDQGVWYRISAPLALAGIPRVVMQQTIEFAFTRAVPCTARDAKPACVELVLHITPNDDTLAHWLAEMRADGSLLHYDGSVEIRIVTDPQTLLPYAREEREYWYASIGNGRNDQIIESEHTVESLRWLAPAPGSNRH
ncbi:MAG: hypothetical protein ACREUG_12870 [Steroidobacteraceae bacterium]